MKIDAIRKTAVCRFDAKEKVYVVESPMLDIIAGVAETEEESWAIFVDLLQAAYIEYLEGRMVGSYKRGRPAKGGIHLHVQVKPETREQLSVLAKEFGISQGEVIDFLSFAYSTAEVNSSLKTGEFRIGRQRIPAIPPSELRLRKSRKPTVKKKKTSARG